MGICFKVSSGIADIIEAIHRRRGRREFTQIENVEGRVHESSAPCAVDAMRSPKLVVSDKVGLDWLPNFCAANIQSSRRTSRILTVVCVVDDHKVPSSLTKRMSSDTSVWGRDGSASHPRIKSARSYNFFPKKKYATTSTTKDKESHTSRSILRQLN